MEIMEERNVQKQEEKLYPNKQSKPQPAVKKSVQERMMILNRKEFSLTGVVAVAEFSSKEVLIELSDISLLVTGDDFQIKSLDVDNGLLELTGEVFALKYIGTQTSKSFFKKIFK